MHLLHKWGKWEEYNKEFDIYESQKYARYVDGKQIPIRSIEIWHKRSCKECGYTQRKEVTGF